MRTPLNNGANAMDRIESKLHPHAPDDDVGTHQQCMEVKLKVPNAEITHQMRINLLVNHPSDRERFARMELIKWINEQDHFEGLELLAQWTHIYAAWVSASLRLSERKQQQKDSTP